MTDTQKALDALDAIGTDCVLRGQSYRDYVENERSKWLDEHEATIRSALEAKAVDKQDQDVCLGGKNNMKYPEDFLTAPRKSKWQR